MTRTLVWPDGTVYTIIRSSHETAGVELEMEWRLPARGWELDLQCCFARVGS